MSAKSSELFLLFQNKAHHYQNINSAKSRVQNHLSQSINHTIDAISKHNYDRDLPLDKRYSIEVANKHMTERLYNIYEGGTRPILNDGNYVRYNKFERQFRTKNHCRSKGDKLIHQQNQKIQDKISRIKSGTAKYWQSEYKEQKRFTKGMGEPATQHQLQLDSKPFMAKPYLQLIQQLQQSQRKGLVEDSKVSSKQGRGQQISIGREKLFALPQFPLKQTRVKKSKVSVRSDERSSVRENKE